MDTEKAMLSQQSPTETCRHHWMIQVADGPVSVGVCRFCLETREFKNYIDAWFPDPWRIRAASTAVLRRSDES